MQPLKPDQKRAILENSPQAQPGDIREYERLLSLRFTEDPDQRPAGSPAGPTERAVTPDSVEGRELRIRELHCIESCSPQLQAKNSLKTKNSLNLRTKPPTDRN